MEEIFSGKKFNAPEFSSDFMILIITSISSFEKNKMNPFPALTASHSLFFPSKLSIRDEVAFHVNLAKTSLAKGAPKSNSSFLPKSATFLPIILTIILPRNSLI